MYNYENDEELEDFGRETAQDAAPGLRGARFIEIVDKVKPRLQLHY